MKWWQVLSPHLALLVTVAAAAWAARRFPARIRGCARVAVLLLTPAAALLTVAYLPAVESGIRMMPRGDTAAATQAVVLCFSYLGERPAMRPGPANVELLAYVRSLPRVNRIYVQEGVWVALLGAPQSPNGPNQLRVVDRIEGREVSREFVRFHRHDPTHYLNTFDALRCAARLLDPTQTTVLVTHELQQWRADQDLRKLCPRCTVVIPPIRGISFVPGGTHLQARSRPLYKLVELFLSRPRDYFARPLAGAEPDPPECCGPTAR